jgi:hypothetical protein
MCVRPLDQSHRLHNIAVIVTESGFRGRLVCIRIAGNEVCRGCTLFLSAFSLYHARFFEIGRTEDNMYAIKGE